MTALYNLTDNGNKEKVPLCLCCVQCINISKDIFIGASAAPNLGNFKGTNSETSLCFLFRYVSA